MNRSAMLAGTIVAICTIFLACTKKNSISDPDADRIPNDSTGGPNYSATAQYPVPLKAGAVVSDSISGLDFQFPVGGIGTFEVARIDSMDGVSEGQTAFEVRTGDNVNIELLLPSQEEGGYAFLYAMLSTELVLGGNDTAHLSWQEVPALDTVGGKIVFDISEVQQGLHKRAASWKGIGQYKILTVPKGTTGAATQKRYRELVDSVMSVLLASLPLSRKSIATALAAGDLKYSVTVDEYAKSGKTGDPYYRPFWSHTILTPRCKIRLHNFCTRNNAAHETGHYFHHLLTSNSFYYYNAVQKARCPHGIGMDRGSRSNIVEETAFLSEYQLTGSIGGTTNPENGVMFRSYFDESTGRDVVNSPRVVDFPSLEGFGAAMLVSVLRTIDEITDYKENKRKVPMVTGVGFGDLWDLIAQGNGSVESLRMDLDSILKITSQECKLPSMLQPLGWTYRVKCRFFDAGNKPLKGVTARGVSICDKDTFFLPKGGVPSGDDGAYSIEEFYPGNTILRIYLPGGADSFDIPRTIDWSTPTTDEVDFGDIVILAGVSIKPSSLSGRTNQKYTFVASVSGTAPTKRRFVWTFGDLSNAVTVENDSTVVHSFTKEGTFKVKVLLENPVTGNVLDDDSIQAVISVGVPKIDTLIPRAAAHGDTLTIRGSAFGQAKDSASAVIFYYDTAARYLRWSDTAIVLVVPEQATDGEVKVLSAGTTSYGKSIDILARNPEILSIDPAVCAPFDMVTIRGKSLKYADLPGKRVVKVYISGANYALQETYFSSYGFAVWEDTLIKAIIPYGAKSGSLWVMADDSVSNRLDIGIHRDFSKGVSSTVGISIDATVMESGVEQKTVNSLYGLGSGSKYTSGGASGLVFKTDSSFHTDGMDRRLISEMRIAIDEKSNNLTSFDARYRYYTIQPDRTDSSCLDISGNDMPLYAIRQDVAGSDTVHTLYFSVRSDTVCTSLSTVRSFSSLSDRHITGFSCNRASSASVEVKIRK